MATILLDAIIGYLLGSIPTGVWLGKAFRGIDIREHGSKSIGATNVFRVLGAKLAIAVLLIDVAKGFMACLIASRINLGDTLLSSNQLAMIGGLLAIVGHLFPLFARFRGGKGVATGAGMLLFLAPLEIAFALLVFIVTLILTRYVSLGSILATFLFSLSIILQKYCYYYPLGDEMVGLAIFLLLLILFTHRANINRLMHGKENKLGAKRT
jgi:acyl phosphate:glycerol-3-phosphate acyltransferase